MNDATKESMEEPLIQPCMSMIDLKALRLDALSTTQVYAYGVGHVLNDVVAGLFLNYALYYLVEIEPIDDTGKACSIVGIVFLVGQVLDGLVTPLVGIFSDKFDTRCGKRMPWYYVGIFLVAIPIIYTFQPCLLCSVFGKSSFMSFVNYTLMNSITNIGWAICQVSHMSLVPSLSLSRQRRDMLNNLRGMFTFISNLAVLVLAFGLFQIIESEKRKYEILCQVAVGFSFLTSLFFVYQIREKPLTQACRKLAKEYKSHYMKLLEVTTRTSILTNEYKSFKIDSIDGSFQREPIVVDNAIVEIVNVEQKEKTTSNKIVEKSKVVENFEIEEEINKEEKEEKEKKEEKEEKDENFRWYHWFRCKQFWLYGLVYMSARVYNNVATGLMLFYLGYSLDFKAGSGESKTPFVFALVPMVVFLSSSLTAGQLTKLYKNIGRKKVFLIATVFSGFIAAGEFSLPSDFRGYFFVIAAILGTTQSALLNTSTAYISEVVGVNGANGAFVYGFYSLFEKLANGILLWLILHMRDVNNRASDHYLRVCISVIPFAAAVLGLSCVLIGKAPDYQSREGSDSLVDCSEETNAKSGPQRP